MYPYPVLKLRASTAINVIKIIDDVNPIRNMEVFCTMNINRDNSNHSTRRQKAKKPWSHGEPRSQLKAAPGVRGLRKVMGFGQGTHSAFRLVPSMA